MNFLQNSSGSTLELANSAQGLLGASFTTAARGTSKQKSQSAEVTRQMVKADTSGSVSSSIQMLRNNLCSSSTAKGTSCCVSGSLSLLLGISERKELQQKKKKNAQTKGEMKTWLSEQPSDGSIFSCVSAPCESGDGSGVCTWQSCSWRRHENIWPGESGICCV